MDSFKATKLGAITAPTLITRHEAAESLRISVTTLDLLTRRQAIPAVRVGRCVRYRPADLIAWTELGAPTEPGAAERVRKAVRS